MKKTKSTPRATPRRCAVSTGSDFRSPLAKARDKFMESDDGKRLCEPSLLRGTHESQYLRNRIERAWLLGVEYGEKHPCPNTGYEPRDCGEKQKL